MAGCINQLIKKMLRKFLIPNITYIEIMKCFRAFTIVNILDSLSRNMNSNLHQKLIIQYYELLLTYIRFQLTLFDMGGA